MNDVPTADRTSLTKGQDRVFVIAVAALLLVIIATLAALWTMERTRRLQAESALQDTQLKLKSIGNLMFNPMLADTPHPVDRDMLVPRPMTLDGRMVQVFEIPASGGIRLGFLPGDVIAIKHPPATATSSSTSPSEP